MKITKSQLKRIIKEELKSVLSEQEHPAFKKYGVTAPRRIIRDYADFYDYYTYENPLPGKGSITDFWAVIPNEVKVKFMARKGDVGLASGGVK
jgi:hypothetical protein